MERSLVLIALLLTVIAPAFAASTQFDYIPPTNLALTLQPQGDVTPGKPFVLTGTLEARTGTPGKLQVFFETSADLAISPAGTALDRLSASAPARFELKVRPAAGKPDAGGTWVRMRVVYSPDYPAQAREMTDATRYPSSAERKRVLDLISRNQKAKARQTDAVRFFPPTSR